MPCGRASPPAGGYASSLQAARILRTMTRVRCCFRIISRVEIVMPGDTIRRLHFSPKSGRWSRFVDHRKEHATPAAFHSPATDGRRRSPALGNRAVRSRGVARPPARSSRAIRRCLWSPDADSRRTTAWPGRWPRHRISARCPYVRQVLAALGAPLGRTRLMRLDSGAEATRTSTPITTGRSACACTFPSSRRRACAFCAATRKTHMAPGEVWIFDTWRRHNVLNPPGSERIHLVRTRSAATRSGTWRATPGATPPAIALRRRAGSVPDAGNGQLSRRDESLRIRLDLVRLVRGRGCCTTPMRIPWPRSMPKCAGFNSTGARRGRQHGDAREGWAAYAALVRKLAGDRRPIRRRGQARERTGPGAPHQIVADSVRCTRRTWPPATTVPGRSRILARSAARTQSIAGSTGRRSRPPWPSPSIARPLIILCAPRSGSTLLFERLAACSPDWYTVGNESHVQIEGIAALHPGAARLRLECAGASDATPEVTADLRARFLSAAPRSRRLAPHLAAAVNCACWKRHRRMRCAFRFFGRYFPMPAFCTCGASLRRASASLIEGWQSGKFVTYSDLPDWPGPPWSFLLVPGWRDLAGRPLEEIVATQWRMTQEHLLRDLSDIPPSDIRAIDLADFLARPEESLRAICDFRRCDLRSPAARGAASFRCIR